MGQLQPKYQLAKPIVEQCQFKNRTPLHISKKLILTSSKTT
ncbi:hypothetical protein BN1088_1910003 [Sphingobacterium sp. PM2-P1-29]|nr:hypothetical protein BN1088_1910003 [Sphingobacterium sp. PM2-P1-29]